MSPVGIQPNYEKLQKLIEEAKYMFNYVQKSYFKVPFCDYCDEFFEDVDQHSEKCELYSIMEYLKNADPPKHTIAKHFK